MAFSFKTKLLKYLKILVPLSILLAGMQYLVVQYLSTEFNFYLSTWSIYVFHFGITFCTLLALIAVSNILYDKVGFAFIACSLLKMFASLVFLIPLIKAQETSKIPDAFAFFVPYFIYLGIETYFTIRLLGSGESSKNIG